MSEEITELKNKIAELEAQVRVMRGIIVQAMLQRDKEPVETGYTTAKNTVWSTATAANTSDPRYLHPSLYGNQAASAMGQTMSKTLEEAMKPLVTFAKFTEPQA